MRPPTENDKEIIAAFIKHSSHTEVHDLPSQPDAEELLSEGVYHLARSTRGRKQVKLYAPLDVFQLAEDAYLTWKSSGEAAEFIAWDPLPTNSQ